MRWKSLSVVAVLHIRPPKRSSAVPLWHQKSGTKSPRRSTSEADAIPRLADAVGGAFSVADYSAANFRNWDQSPVADQSPDEIGQFRPSSRAGGQPLFLQVQPTALPTVHSEAVRLMSPTGFERRKMAPAARLTVVMIERLRQRTFARRQAQMRMHSTFLVLE